MKPLVVVPAIWRYPLTLTGVFALVWLVLAIAPLNRHDWLLENVIPVFLVALLIGTARALRFTNFTYTCLFIFLVIHEIGAHYTYSLVPYDDWFYTITGSTLNELMGFERNHYDRLVHFLYGLLVTPAAVELFAHYGRYPRVWAILFPTLFITSHSLIYELVEWTAAMVFGGELGAAYLGTQGDVWDSQKDMALALLGTVITICLMMAAGRLPENRPEQGLTERFLIYSFFQRCFSYINGVKESDLNQTGGT